MRYLLIIILSALLAVSPVLATQNIVYPQGTVDVAVPADQYISVFAAGNSSRVFKSVGGPAGGFPTKFALETGGALVKGEKVFGPYTVATTIRIVANADPVYYSVGALAANLAILAHTPRIVYTQFAPVAYNTTTTLLSSDLMVGLLTSTQATGATITLTLPTGTLLDTASGLQINQGFEWTLSNLSAAAADTVTLAAGTGHTIVGVAIVQSVHVSTGGITGATARFFTRKTAANTFITYRIGN